ncbi:hypothetical protein E2542_SST01769 [Spatholobus suberectus]|nr:hypothetical protein E2542_SST01769 [Spatholobus suberectus]
MLLGKTQQTLKANKVVPISNDAYVYVPPVPLAPLVVDIAIGDAFTVLIVQFCDPPPSPIAAQGVLNLTPSPRYTSGMANGWLSLSSSPSSIYGQPLDDGRLPSGHADLVNDADDEGSDFSNEDSF